MSIYLIDGHALIWHCLKTPGAELCSPAGEPTRGTYFFTQKILAICKERNPSHLIVAMDSKRDLLWRREWYPPYKSNRVATADEDPSLNIQFKRCRQIIKALTLPICRIPRWEADDVIASLVHRIKETHCPKFSGRWPVTIVTGDKDLQQLCTADVSIWNPFTEVTMTPAAVEARWGVSRDQLGDYLALAGDSSDKVPGIAKVGEKTARLLLNAYQNIEGIVRAVEEGKIGGVVGDNIYRASRDGTLTLMRRLVRMEHTLEVPSLDEYRFYSPNIEAAQPIFQELGFRIGSAQQRGILRARSQSIV